MNARFTHEACRALDAYLMHVQADNPVAALAALDRVQAAVALLAENPGLGREGRVHGFARVLRAWPVAGLPLVLFYSVRGSTLWVHRVHHGARRPITH